MSNTDCSLFQCPICLEDFVNPKALPCLHTFCKLCIGTYIRSSSHYSGSSVTFHCPVCRKEVQTTESSGDPAGKLQDNYLLKQLKETSELEIDKNVACVIHKNKHLQFHCTNHNLLVCPTCLLTNHRTCDVTEISDLLEKRKQNIKETKVRMVNAKEKLQLKIQVLESNRCNMLSDIVKCKDGFRMYVKEIRTLITKAETKFMNELDALENKLIFAFDGNLSESTKAFTEVTKILNDGDVLNVQACNDYFKLEAYDGQLGKMEHQLSCTNLVHLHKERGIQFSPNMELFKILRQENVLGRIECKDTTDMMAKQSSDEELKILSMHTKNATNMISVPLSLLRNSTNDLRRKTVRSSLTENPARNLLQPPSSDKVSINTHNHSNTEVQPGQATLNFRIRTDVRLKNVGSWLTENPERILLQPPSFDDASIHTYDHSNTEVKPRQATLNFHTQTDKMECFITGMAILENRRFLVADHGNTKIKYFNSDGTLLNQMVFSSEPWAVCSIENREFVASFPTENLIQYFKLKKNCIVAMQGKVSVNGRCYGLSYHSNKIAVCVRRANGTSMCIYNKFSNQLISEIQTSSAPSLSGIWYLAFTSDGKKLVYADEEKNCMACVDFVSGKQHWKRNVVKPRGVAVFRESIFIASREFRYLKRFSQISGNVEDSVGSDEIGDVNCISINHKVSVLLVSKMDGGEVTLLDFNR